MSIYNHSNVTVFRLGETFYNQNGHEVENYKGLYWYGRSIFKTWIDNNGERNFQCLDTDVWWR